MRVDRKAAIKKLRTLALTSKSDVDVFRMKIEETFQTVFLPNGVEKQEVQYGEIPCDVLYPQVYSSRKVILYIHGGSFVAGSRASYRNFCASLANETSCRVVLPEFRLPPTHPYPASLDDIVKVFKEVYVENQLSSDKSSSALGFGTGVKKYDPEIIIAADGSGASLAMALLFKIKDMYIKGVRNVIFFSPWLDLTSDAEIIKNRKYCDEVLSGESLHRAADLYTYAANLSNPYVSPLKASEDDFKDLPPFYIQMGAKEILIQQANELKAILEKAGVECTLDVWDDMVYMFQMADEYFKESHLAMEKIGNYIVKRDTIDKKEEEERQKVLRKNDILV